MFQIKSIIADKPGFIISAACAVLGAIFLLHTATLWWPAKTEVQNLKTSSRSALEFDVDRIVSSSVFSNQQSSVVSNKAAHSVVSHSEFSLQAIFESADVNRSTVIIAKSGQKPRSYNVGEELAEGISISAIERDRVHLSSHGQPAVLTFKQQAHTPGNTIQRAADKLLGKMSAEGKLGQVKQRLEQLRRQSQEQ